VSRRVPNLAQTRHTRPAEHGKSWLGHRCSATTSVAAPFRGDHTHDKLVHKSHNFEPLSGRTRPSPFRVRLKPSIPSVCDNRFRTCSRAARFRLAGGDR
jgi:hypothetical protein